MDERVTLPGPAVLGRGLVVAPGGEVPAGAREWPRLRIDDAVLAAPDEAVAVLDAAWRSRQAAVVELAVPLGALKQPETCDEPPYDLDPGFAFNRERLHFLVWANRYDGRGEQPRWHHAARAQRLGATPTTDPSQGDVLLPDGTPAWIDGGPRTGRLLDGGAAVVHVNQLWAGSLEPDRWRSPGDALAPDQLAAVGHPGGPARVLAPAGSGKTRVLTARLRHLLVDRGWAPGTVTALAYNTRAAGEMRARTGDVPGAQVRTLHSLGFDILGQARGGRPRVLDDRTTRDLLQELAPVRPRANDDVYAPYVEALAEVRAALRSPELVEVQRDDVPDFARVFAAYRERLAGMGAIDFDEQVYGAVEVLLQNPELRQAAQRRCAHVLLDELQDLTPAQLLLVRLLAAPAYDVYGVGDDDQVIYGYAGADPRFLVDYDQFFPGAASYLLEVNYRCPPPVVEAATHLLSYNHHRVPKPIRPAPRSGSPSPDTHPRPDGHSPSDDPDGPSDLAALPTPPGTTGSAPTATPGDPPPGTTGSAPTATPGDPLPETSRDGRGLPDGWADGLVVERHTDDRLGGRLVDVVQALVDEGVSPSDIAVLTRVNAGLLAPQVLLAEAGVPVQATVDERMLDRTGTRASLAWLRLAAAAAHRQPLDGGDLATVARRPTRGLSPGLLRALGRGTWPLSRLASFANGLDDTRLRDKLTGLHDDLARLADRYRASPTQRHRGATETDPATGGDASPEAALGSAAGTGSDALPGSATDGPERATAADLLLYVRDVIGLGRALDRLDDARSAPGGGHIDDLDALILVARAHPDPTDFEPWLRQRLRSRSRSGRDHRSPPPAMSWAEPGDETPPPELWADDGVPPPPEAWDPGPSPGFDDRPPSRLPSKTGSAELDHGLAHRPRRKGEAGAGLGDGPPPPQGMTERGAGLGDGPPPQPRRAEPGAGRDHGRPPPALLDVEPATAPPTPAATTGGRVTLSTVHRVKGLEWPYVIVWDASDGVMPHRLNQSGPFLEEERRVFHVALTRARQRAIVLARSGAPSPFLTELTGEAPHSAPSAPRSVRDRASDVPGRASGDAAERLARRRTAKGGKGSAVDEGELDPAATKRADALRDWRRRRAAEDGVPAYVILHDRHILGIARANPSTLDELAACDGIGPTKLDRYGDEILAVLADLP